MGESLNELALFAGAGGGLLASELLGWNTVGAVEIEKYPREVLLQRQWDGMLNKFPIWDDVCTFDGTPWRGSVDVISGGFPCQDISSAGKGEGLTGSRSRLWFEYLRIIEEVKPKYVFAENSPNLRTKGLGTIIQGLTGLGYDVRWGVLGAGHVGSIHERKRMWVVAKHNTNSTQRKGGGVPSGREPRHTNTNLPSQRSQWWAAEPSVGRVGHGVASRLDRLKAIGNGQVPLVAATAWDILSEGIK